MVKKADEAKAAQWRSHIQAWRRSGLSQAAYCRDHDLVCSQFGYWRRKLRSDSRSASGFVQVMTAPSTGGLSVRLPGGVEIKGVDDGNVAVVAELLARLS